MRKPKRILILFLLLIMFPIQAFASNNGSLISVVWKYTSNNSNATGTINLIQNASIYTTFNTDTTISRVVGNTNNAQALQVEYFGSSNNLLYSYTTAGVNYASLPDISGVRKIVVSNPYTNTANGVQATVYAIGADTTPPGNVTNLKSTNVSDTNFDVSWTVPLDSDLDKFKVYLNGTLKNTVMKTTNTYSFSSLISNTSYVVKVTSLDTVGNESTGSTITVKTNIPPDVTAPSNVTNLTATPTFKSVSLSWTNPPETDFARVKIYEDGVYQQSVTAAEGNTAFFDNLTPETDYSFKVTSVDTTGNESSGSVIDVTTLPSPEIKKIKNLEATPKFDRVKLSWELPDSEYFHHVNIYRKVVEDKSFFQSLFSMGVMEVSAAITEDGYKPMFETNGTYWTDLTVDPETKYEYKLTSENVDGRESEEGVVVQVSTLEEPKPVLKDAQFQHATNGDYVIGWSEPTTGNVKIKVGGKDYKTVPANLKTYTIPKTDLAYTTIGDPDVTIQPVTARGTEGDSISNPKSNLPFSVKDLIESGNGLLWLISPFILLALAFLLVPKLRNLIVAAFRGNKDTTESNRRRFQAEKESKGNLKEESVQTSREPRQPKMPRIRADRIEREPRATRQSTREPRRRRGS
jgi:hypothetical protein